MFQIFLQREIAQTFMEKFVAKTSQLRVGDPLDEQTFCGAVNSKVHYEKVMSYIMLARKDGATIHCGETGNTGKHSKGFFVRPTIISGLEDQHKCMQEEIFGPVTCVAIFDTEVEAVERINNTRRALLAGPFSCLNERLPV